MFYFILTGKHYFAQKSAENIRASVTSPSFKPDVSLLPEEMKHIVQGCMAPGLTFLEQSGFTSKLANSCCNSILIQVYAELEISQVIARILVCC